MRLKFLPVLLILFLSFQSSAQKITAPNSAAAKALYPAPAEADFIINNFRFGNGEVLPELRLHYTTIGAPVRDKSGAIRNAVLILHGTGGAGNQFLSEQFAEHQLR